MLADLSGQNPNVFYELGVRHSLRPRTILIAQNLDDIPSDLREYRTIIYDTSARGASRFKKKINEFLKEIYKEPERADNPVLDRLGSITDSKLTQVESERDELKKELTMFLSWKKKTSEHRVSTEVRKRFNRILCLKNAKQQSSFSLGGHDGTFKRGENKFSLPLGQGNFKLYFLSYKEIIKEFWYVSIHETSASIIEELADVRVLLENCSKDQEAVCDFILVVGSEIPNKKEYHKKFNQMKKKINKNYQKFFNFHLLDPVELEKWEKELALKV